jgi:hypothetical protein
MYIPPEQFDTFVDLLIRNGAKVDDMCDVCRDGKLITVWIPETEVEYQKLEDKPGYFIARSREYLAL